jgi:hypothetical protein
VITRSTKQSVRSASRFASVPWFAEFLEEELRRRMLGVDVIVTPKYEFEYTGSMLEVP